jgi:ABC-type spermidine/putrescine transport system permease subunit I
VGEFLEAIGWLLELLIPAAAPEAQAGPALDGPNSTAVRPAHGDLLIRSLTLLLGTAFVALTIAVPVAWATGRAEGLTLAGLVVAALIAGRSTYLLARYRRSRSLV